MIHFDPAACVESLYIHWPFCPYKCHFCPFVALAAHDEYMVDYHRALTHEIIAYADAQTNKVPLKTIFIGGGTPSTYPEKLLLDTFDILYKKYSFVDNAEISLEVNPGTITLEKIKTWKRAGINRISVGIQSLDDDILKKLNRHQKASDVIQLFDMATDHFDNISVDLIIGLPGVSRESWHKLIETIVRWPIKHVSLYLLMVHEDTPLYFGVKTKRITLPSDDEVIDTYIWSIDTLARYGYQQYEISNFSKPTYESQHNSMYWMRKPYKGLGLGACSFDGTARFQNEKNLMNYMAKVMTGNHTIMHEILTERDVWLEQLMLGMRQARGVDIRMLLPMLSHEQQQHFLTTMHAIVESGLLTYNDPFLALTAKGRAVEQEISTRLAII